MLETEVSPSGSVLVEGHHVGELQGFRFTADQSASGEDGKAIRAAAQKALAAEFDARAERFAISPNNDIALGSDGVLRWIGAPIATLVAGDDPLKPRAVLLADEQLTGPARDKVAARAERFVSFQVETLLKPLVDLKGAEQLAGIGRGIAFRLVENFGLINRREIAEDVKQLDQAGRAALRRLGVRFGAYHIFVPTLIKPAPAGLVTLLWALLTPDGKDRPGFGDVVNALATGRTSLVVDPAFDKTFYRLAGFRPLGRRAVRVDILERLADQIRPALAWKAGTGPRPGGAYDGAAFMVTPPMMSILGANADDMEEILKGLGYRGEPKPAAEVKARLEALDQAAREAAERARAAKAAAEASAIAQAEPLADASAQAETRPDAENKAAVDATQAEAVPLEAASWAPDVSAPPAIEAPALAEPETPIPDSSEAAPVTAPEPEAAEAPQPQSAETEAVEAAEDTAPAAVETAEAPAQAEPAEEPKPILLWRIGRFDRPRHQHDRQRHQRGRPQGERNATSDAGQQADVQQPGSERPKFRSGRPDDGEKRERKPWEKGPRPERGERPQGARDGGRPPRGDDHRRQDERGRKPEFRQPPRREERPAKIDPLSPFAKLAALRDQLKK